MTKRLQAGTVIGEYEINGLLGEGTFGTVYAAQHPVIGKRAAVKVLKHEAAADSQTVQRFKGEALAVNAIEHPNIVDIFGFGHLPDGRPYLIMEYLRGSSLEDILVERGGSMPIGELMPILRSVARAVDAAHQAGVIHRDLKPDNIFVARPASGMQVIKVLDFGVAKLMFQKLGATQPGVPIGTPWYMAPEQCFGKNVDHRVDVYGFGVIAFRCLTGAFPVDGDTYADIIKCHLMGERLRASAVAPALADYDAILLRCLDVIPDERFDSLDAAYKALRSVHRVRAQAPALAPASVPASAPASVPASAPASVPANGIDVDEDKPTTRVARMPSTPVPAPRDSQKLDAAEAQVAATPSKGGTWPGPLAANEAGNKPLGKQRHTDDPLGSTLPDTSVPVHEGRTQEGPNDARADELSEHEPRDDQETIQMATMSAPVPVSAPERVSSGYTPGDMAAVAPRVLQQTTLSGSNAELYKIPSRFSRRTIFALVAVAIGLVVGLVVWSGSGHEQPRPYADVIARADDALQAYRWSDAQALAQDVLKGDPSNRDGLRIDERAREELANERLSRAFKSAVAATDVRAARDAMQSMSANSVYRPAAEEAYRALADRFLVEQTKAMSKLLLKNRCAKARKLLQTIETALPAVKDEVGDMYDESRCPRRSGARESRRKSPKSARRTAAGEGESGTTDDGDARADGAVAGAPAAMFERARRADKNGYFETSFTLCRDAMRKSARSTRPDDLAFCTVSACKAGQRKHAQAWLNAISSRSAREQPARQCARSDMILTVN